jgi:molybdenum cofactor guanylyltransferase
MDFSGILLAGGKSLRFGPNKIKIMSGRVPLLIEQAVKLGFFTGEIIISTSLENRAYIETIFSGFKDYLRIMDVPRDYARPSVTTVVDDNIIAGSSSSIGPIAGIYTGLKNINSRYGLVLAADMPFISSRFLEFLTAEAGRLPFSDAVITKNSKGTEALCGIYSRKCIRIITESIKKGVYKISDILGMMDVRWIGIKDLKSQGIDIYNFFNINLPEDIQKYEYLLEKGVEGYGTDNIRSRSGQKWKDNFYRGTGKGALQEEI